MATDWYVTVPFGTGLVSVENGLVVKAAPIFGWMVGESWLDAKRYIKRKGGHGEVIPERDEQLEL